MRRPGIHFRLVVAAILVIGATSAALGYMGIKIFHEYATSRFDDRIAFMARSLALNAELGILIGEKDMLQNLANSILSEKDVAEVSIISQRAGQLAHVSRNIEGPLHQIAMPVTVKTSRAETRAFNPAAGEDQADQQIGEVQIVYSTGGINRFLADMSVRFMILTAGMAGVAVIIFYFISRSLVAPLTQLSQTAQKVGEGDLKVRLKQGHLPETREVASAFNAMLDSLEKSRVAVEEANKQMMRQNTLAEMGKFSLMVAHEVKNPLGIMKSSVDFLKKRTSDHRSNIMVGYIEDEIARLNRLIEDFLAFARPVKPYFRDVDFDVVLRKAILAAERQFEDRQIDIKTELKAQQRMVFADPDLCERMIANLLKNAIDASAPGGQILVRACSNDGNYIFEVADEGPGIEEGNMKKIFEPFFTTRAKGTGLGLAYVLQIINTHGGQVSAANREQGGAVFTVEIPLKQ